MILQTAFRPTVMIFARLFSRLRRTSTIVILYQCFSCHHRAVFSDLSSIFLGLRQASSIVILTNFYIGVSELL